MQRLLHGHALATQRQHTACNRPSSTWLYRSSARCCTVCYTPASANDYSSVLDYNAMDEQVCFLEEHSIIALTWKHNLMVNDEDEVENRGARLLHDAPRQEGVALPQDKALLAR